MNEDKDLIDNLDELSETAVGCFTKLGKVIAMVFAGLLATFTLMYLFNNFISATFSIARINMFQAFGIMLLKTYFSKIRDDAKTSTREDIVKSILKSVVLLALGFICVRFI